MILREQPNGYPLRILQAVLFADEDCVLVLCQRVDMIAVVLQKRGSDHADVGLPIVHHRQNIGGSRLGDLYADIGMLLLKLQQRICDSIRI